MPITEKQRIARKNHLGSSDVAAICGMSPFQNAYDVWLEKTDQLDETQARKPWLATGNEFESIILSRAAQKLGKLRRNQYRSLKSASVPLASHIDAIVVATGEPVEAKSCGVFWPIQEEWGEPGTDQVPDRVILQAQVHLAVTGAAVCHVPALFWGLRQELYAVPRDEPMIAELLEYLKTWWDKHVVHGQAPEGMPTLDVIRRAKRTAGRVVQVSDDLVARWRRYQEAEGRVKKMKEAALVQLLAEMGDAEIAECGLGRVTYKAEERAGYTVPPMTVRIPRFKKTK